MRNGKKILAGCLMAVAVSTLMMGCGNRNNNTTGTETTSGTNAVNDNDTNNEMDNGVTEKNTIQNDGAENMDNGNGTNDNADGGVLEDVGAGIGEAGDDIIDGAADAVDRLADDGIDSENGGTTNTGVQ